MWQCKDTSGISSIMAGLTQVSVCFAAAMFCLRALWLHTQQVPLQTAECSRSLVIRVILDSNGLPYSFIVLKKYKLPSFHGKQDLLSCPFPERIFKKNMLWLSMCVCVGFICIMWICACVFEHVWKGQS